MKGPIQLVIFDFDGTIVDTAPDLIRAANLFLESQGFDSLPHERIRAAIGMGLRRLILELYPEQEHDDHTRRRIEGEFLKVYEREFLHSPRIYPGLEAFLHDWEGHIAIVSNKRSRFIRPILKHTGLDKFRWVSIIGGDTYPNMKPHPEPFLGAMQAAGVTPEETVIVGDGTPDVAGALAVGSRCIAIDFGYTPVDELMQLGAWSKINSYDELLPLIHSIT